MVDLKIEYLPVTALKPYERNPRKVDRAVDYVANSIREFGFKVPIVVDRQNVIVCGHVRYKAAKKLKLESVPVIVADDLTEEQVNAFRLIDNKTQELSSWNFSKLIEELETRSRILTKVRSWILVILRTSSSNAHVRHAVSGSMIEVQHE